jgi:hypothetical protein
MQECQVMGQAWKRFPFGVLAMGFGLGLCLGLGVLIGFFAGLAWHDEGRQPITFPETPLHAMATDSGETFSIATGLIADGVEGVFFLDYLTGVLQCWVVSGRTGLWTARYYHNVIEDLGVEQGKKPKYLMVTGVANMSRGSAAFRPADSLVYVADANTGRFAVYALPWNRNAAAANAPQFSKMVFMGGGWVRDPDLLTP